MSRRPAALLTSVAMLAFAGNSLLCRLALRGLHIDAASFTSIRLLAGALTLCVIVRMRGAVVQGTASWLSALALFAYAAGFSFAYLTLSAGPGALLLFGAVQATMIGYSVWSGVRIDKKQITGLAIAFGGLMILLLPASPADLSAPPALASGLMLAAGIAWGIYSLRGRAGGEPIQTNAGNFLRAIPFAIALMVATRTQVALDNAGFWFALASGAVTSGLGYAVWYTALKGLSATQAASVQLSVPVLAAIGGILFLGEPPTLRLLTAAIAILGGIGLVIVDRPGARIALRES